MTIQRHVFLMIMCVIGFALLTALFMNARGAERGMFVFGKERIRELRELDARLDSQTLQARFSLSGSFDPLVDTQAQALMRFRELELHGDPSVAPGVANAKAAYLEKRDLMEDIKTQAAVLRNSARYLPVALDEVEAQPLAAEMRRALLPNVLAPSAGARARMAELAAKLEASPDARSPALQRALRHARVLSERSEQLDRLVASYLAVPSRQRLEEANLAYDASRQRQDDRASVYRLALYVASGALMFYVAAVLLHLARLNRSVRRFVPYEFLHLLGKSSVADIAVGDCMQQEMTVLFADIRSFTTISEKLSPRGVFGFINQYMARMEPCIQGHNGVVSQYYGDGIMAIFAGTADQAVDGAVAMLSALKVFNAERAAAGEPPIKIGIGLNTGPLILGTIGGPERLECNVISDVVNFSSRIEGMNKMYGTSLLISDRTYSKLMDTTRHRFRVVDHVRVKGMERPCTVYEVMDGEDQRALPEYEMALKRYDEREFVGAAALFKMCRDKLPGELLFEVWHERCERFVKNPPPRDWDGVVRLEEK